MLLCGWMFSWRMFVRGVTRVAPLAHWTTGVLRYCDMCSRALDAPFACQRTVTGVLQAIRQTGLVPRLSARLVRSFDSLGIH